MRLTPEACWTRLAEADRAVLATVHPERGVDAVPVVFAITEDRRIVLPVDTVKPKSGRRLGRLRNLERDPSCVLLADHYASEWEQLWWVRVHGEADVVAADADLVALLADRYPDYREPGAIAELIVLRPTAITGWAATG